MNAGPVQGALSSPLDTRVGRAGRLRRPRTLGFVWTSCRPPAHLTWLHTPHPREVGWIPAKDTPHLESPISCPTAQFHLLAQTLAAQVPLQFSFFGRPGWGSSRLPFLSSPRWIQLRGREERLRTRWFEVELQ